VSSDTKILATDLLSPSSFEMEHIQVGHGVSLHPTNGLDQRDVEAYFSPVPSDPLPLPLSPKPLFNRDQSHLAL